MTSITCDTNLGDDGNIHAVIFHPHNLAGRTADPWNDTDIGSTLTLIDQTTGAVTVGTLTAYEVSDQPGPYGATRVELTVTPT